MMDMEQVDKKIGAVLKMAAAYAAARGLESKLEDERALVKSEAISRIMGLPDPQKEGKLYSATAAEKLVETDTVFMLHRAEQAKAAADTIMAGAAYRCAQLSAQLAVNMAGAGQVVDA